jgi:hypothetical protein
MKNLIKTSMMLLAGVLMLTTSCNQVSDSQTGANIAGKGTVLVKLTDAPFPVSLVDKVMVTIDKIEIRSVAAESITEDTAKEAKLFTVLSDKVQEFNLLSLQNGITADLLQFEIGVGSYDMIRMHVVSSKITLKDGSVFDMKIPGGSKSGLKIKLTPELVVTSGVVHEVLMDFNVSKSFVAQGNIKSKKGVKGFIFKPVIRAMVEKHSGRIEGKVFENATTPIMEAHVQILRADTVFSSALTDKDGHYALIGIPAGDYKMICDQELYTSVTVDHVIVVAQEKTVQDILMIKK